MLEAGVKAPEFKLQDKDGKDVYKRQVLFFLPTVLIICDKLIEKTTMKTHFYKEGEKNEQLCKN